MSAVQPTDHGSAVTAASADTANSAGVVYTVAVRALCEFAAKRGDLDLRFTPSPTAAQGQAGHTMVTQRRQARYETEVSLSGHYQQLRVRGRADGYDPETQQLEEIKTFKGRLDAIPDNHQALHWAQLLVYGHLLCQSRSVPRITATLVYFDVQALTEHPTSEVFEAAALAVHFNQICAMFLNWAVSEAAHLQARNRALIGLPFPQMPFRPGQRQLAAGVYRTAALGGTLLAQAPTGIGKTIGTLYPALRAAPERGTDKVFYLTAKTPGRGVALAALQLLVDAMPQLKPVPGPGDAIAAPLRVVELVAKDKACEHKDKACHGDSCPLARGFYDRLPAARQAAAAAAWMDRAALRQVALNHHICPYFLGHEMLRWADVVVGDYNHYFDRSAVLWALTMDHSWRVSVLVDEAHNLYSRACNMYSAELTQIEAVAARQHAPPQVRRRIDELLSSWQLLMQCHARWQIETQSPQKMWRLLPEPPEAFARNLQKLNIALSEHFNDSAQVRVPATAVDVSSTQSSGLLGFYFGTLAFATLVDEFGEHSLCEFDASPPVTLNTPHANDSAPALHTADDSETAGLLRLRCVVPAPFLAQRIRSADSLTLFSATLNPPDYYFNLLGLPEATQVMHIDSPFHADQLAVRVLPISTRRDHRSQNIGAVAQAMAAQHAAHSGNYLAFFSSFEYMEMAAAELRLAHPRITVWTQERVMTELARDAFLARFQTDGSGIAFAVLGGVFGEGVDLPGTRLVGAFVATLGLPQFDGVNEAIAERMDTRFGKGREYTYTYPGMQKVVQAAGRVIRSRTDHGTLLLIDDRYAQHRYRSLLPAWWRLG